MPWAPATFPQSERWLWGDGAPVGQINVWMTTVWEKKPVKVWTGTVWETDPMKFHNGVGYRSTA